MTLHKQCIHCLKTLTPIVLPLHNVKGALVLAYLSEPFMESLPSPTQAYLPSAPPPQQNVLSPTFYSLNVNPSFTWMLSICWSRSLSHSLWVADLTFLIVEPMRQRWSAPQPAGMTSKGGKPVGWRGACLETLPSPIYLAYRCDILWVAETEFGLSRGRSWHWTSKDTSPGEAES